MVRLMVSRTDIRPCASFSTCDSSPGSAVFAGIEGTRPVLVEIQALVAGADEAVESLTAAIEPMMIVFLGGIVGLIVAGMFLPMFSIIGALSQ